MGRQRVITILLCLLTGFAGYWLGGASSRQTLAKLQSAIDQSQTAEELLAQMMTIFVADLGLRLQSKEFLFSGAQPSPAMAGTGPSATGGAPTPPDSQAPASASSLAPSHSTSAKPSGVNTKPQESSMHWRELEKNRNQVASEREAEDFLKSVQMENLFPIIKAAANIGGDGLRMLSGRFQGKLVFFDGNRKPKDVEMTLTYSGQGASATGSYELIVSQDGQKESHTKGQGGFKHYNGFGEGSSAVLVRLTPDSYLQLYAADRFDGLFGNYYTQESVDKFTPVGTVFLRH